MNTTLKGLSKKRIFLAAGAVSAFLLLAFLSLMLLYVRKPMKFNFDAAYFWAEKRFMLITGFTRNCLPDTIIFFFCQKSTARTRTTRAQNFR